MGGGGEGVVPLEQSAAEGRQTGAEPAAARRRRSRGPGELRGAAIGAREARRRRLLAAAAGATAGSVTASQPQQRLRKSGCRREQAAEVVARAVRSTPPRPPARVPNAECMRGHLPAYMAAALRTLGEGCAPHEDDRGAARAHCAPSRALPSCGKVALRAGSRPSTLWVSSPYMGRRHRCVAPLLGSSQVCAALSTTPVGSWGFDEQLSATALLVIRVRVDSSVVR